MKAHLTLVNTQPQHHQLDAAAEVYEEWRALVPYGDLTPLRLTPARRALVQGWLEFYPGEVISLAIRGCMGSSWCGGANRVGRTFHDLEWILENESRIEKLADEGRRAMSEMGRKAAPAEPERKDEGAKEAARAKLAELRAFLAQRAKR